MQPCRLALVRVVRALGILVGLVLALIGVRFAADPGAAAKFFGIGPGAYPTAFHHVIAVRDLWLGLLAVALAALREWRALALWLGLGMFVCFADALIAAHSGARWWSIAFHSASGVLLMALALAARHLFKRTRGD